VAGALARAGNEKRGDGLAKKKRKKVKFVSITIPAESVKKFKAAKKAGKLR
jgi:hypothetical protein